jgi:hypothetical protein
MDCDIECGNVHDKGTQGNHFRKCNHTTYPLSIRQRAEKKSALWLRGATACLGFGSAAGIVA